MSEILKEHVVTLITTLMSGSGWSAARLAREAGVAPSTVTRALDPKTPFMPSARTINKLVQIGTKQRIDHQNHALKLYDQVASHYRKVFSESGQFIIEGEIKFGTWVTAESTKPDPNDVFNLQDDSLGGVDCRAFRMAAGSDDPEFSPMSIVIVAGIDVGGLYEGDICVVRRRIDTAMDTLFETGLWNVVRESDGDTLKARSPAQYPSIDMHAPVLHQGYEILGCVVARYQRQVRRLDRPIILGGAKLHPPD